MKWRAIMNEVERLPLDRGRLAPSSDRCSFVVDRSTTGANWMDLWKLGGRTAGQGTPENLMDQFRHLATVRVSRSG